MLWLARSLELAPRDATDLQWAIRANLAAWQHELTVPEAILRHSGPVTWLAFEPSGARVTAGSDGGPVQTWDWASGKIVGEESPTARPGDLTESEFVQRLPRPETIAAAAISPDGETLLTGDTDNTARLWDAKTARAIGQPLQHRGIVGAVAFSLDGRTIATGSHDGSVRLWAIGSPGAPGSGLVLPHEHRVWSAAFTPDGERLLTASGNFDTLGTAQLWHAATGSGNRCGTNQ